MTFKKMQAAGAGSRQTLDLAEVRRALAVLADPNGYCELRGLRPYKSRVCKGSDLDGLCEAAASLAESNAIYFALNPIAAGAATASAKTVDRRRWFLIDVDPVKSDADSSA